MYKIIELQIIIILKCLKIVIISSSSRYITATLNIISFTLIEKKFVKPCSKAIYSLNILAL
jgi:hypothetical protein